MRILKFTDSIAWQKARVITKQSYTLFKDSKDFAFKDQICRASISIMNNIAEGFERQTNKELKNFLYIAKGSTGEVHSMAYSALDLGYISQPQFEELEAQLIETAKVISGLIKTL